MAWKVTVFASVDEQLERDAQDVLDNLGLSMGQAVELFLRQVAESKRLPFEADLSALAADDDDEWDDDEPDVDDCEPAEPYVWDPSMTPTVKLKDVVDGLDMTDDTWGACIDLDTGEVKQVLIDGSMFDYDEEELEEDEPEHALMLPDRYEIHEYKIMEDFADSRSDERVAERLSIALDGRGAFRRFKDELYRLGIEKDWYAFRDEAFERIAREFLEGHGLRWE